MTKKPILELLGERYGRERDHYATSDGLTLRLVLAMELHCEHQAEALELERTRLERAVKLDDVLAAMGEASDALGKSLATPVSMPPTQPRSFDLGLFSDVIAPAVGMVTDLSDKQRLGQLFDMAVIFGAIQAREGTGGFDALTLGELRDLYNDKRLLGDGPTQ